LQAQPAPWLIAVSFMEAGPGFNMFMIVSSIRITSRQQTGK
jgi:hypothetical protein